jgi:hypothetical protein
MLDPQVLDSLALDSLALDSLALDFLTLDFLTLYQDLPLRMEFPHDHIASKKTNFQS